MKRVFIFVFTMLVFLFPGAVRAQESEHIESYDVNIAIRKDGTIGVTEKIDYFFDSPRHGIFRDIPVIKANSDGKKYSMTLTNISVTDHQGQAYAFTQSGNGDNEELKIGDPSRTITGAHWYYITYDVAGALTYFSGHDELYWNAVGTQWPVSINKATVTVTLPQSVTPVDLHTTCYIGAQGATAGATDCSISRIDDKTTLFEVDRTLESNEGATIVIGFPKGMVAQLEPKEVVPFFDTPQGKVALIAIVIAAFLWYLVLPFFIIRKWWTSGRDPKPAMGEVSAWFSPPKTQKLRDLTPAETGTLVDESADLRDIYATIVDLARRGYMKIIETKTKRMLAADATGYDFQKQKDWDAKADTSVQPFEKTLLDAIFQAKDKVTLKDLDLHAAFETVKKQIYDSLVADGFFPKNPQTVRTKYYVLGFFALITGNIFLMIVAFIFGKNMPKKTLFGAEQAAVTKSLNNFLVSQDRQLAFQAKNQMMFEKLLPYAIAFGVEEIWAGRFKGLGLKQPDWYVSANRSAFNAVVFSNALGRSMSVSFASSVTSKSSSGYSSGFSGGFSGGGGGGGGGGSW